MLPFISRGTVYRETVSQKVIGFRVLCYPLSPVVLCTVRLCLRKLLFLGCWLPFISRGTVYRETMSQNVVSWGAVSPPPLFLSPVVLRNERLDLTML